MRMQWKRALPPACALLLGLQIAGYAQQNGLADLLGPGRAPAPKVLRDLDASWCRLMVTCRVAVAPGAQQQPATDRCVYTQGRTVTVGGKPMVLAYKAEPAGRPMDAVMESGGRLQPEALISALVPRQAPDSPLAAVLIDPATVIDIRVLRPFDLAKEPGERIDVGTEGAQAAVLAAILLPVFTQARLKAKETSSISNLKQIGLGIEMHAMDHHDRLPNMASSGALRSALAPYKVPDSLFVSPVDDRPYEANSRLSGKRLASIRRRERCALVWEASASSDGKRAVVFADGHAERVPQSRWPGILKASVAR